MSTTCFLITPTGRALRFLRRITLGDATSCLLTGMHQAVTEIEPGPLVRDAGGYVYLEWPHDDPRWPAQCACGYAFVDGDYRCCDQEQLYTLPDGGECNTHRRLTARSDPRTAPPGAMWVADYVPPGDDWSGPDGLCLMLRLPDGTDWMIDGPARNGGGWTRTGEPPHITARPSIASPGYHGWLDNGILSDDLDGRSYP
jgi:hypothetical protein